MLLICVLVVLMVFMEICVNKYVLIFVCFVIKLVVIVWNVWMDFLVRGVIRSVVNVICVIKLLGYVFCVGLIIGEKIVRICVKKCVNDVMLWLENVNIVLLVFMEKGVI